MSFRDSYNTDYQAVGASATDTALKGQAGNAGAANDILEKLIVTISTSGANGTCSIKDGTGSAIPIAPASTPVGVFSVLVGARSQGGAWKVTTGSACTVVAVGRFS